MTLPTGWTQDEMAARVAAAIPEGSCINLGIGLPTRVANHLPQDRELILHSENGIVGMGPDPEPGDEDPDVVNAGKQPVSLIVGAAIVNHADSFMIIRGGRLDFAIMGALQVSQEGDLANWKVGGEALGSVGGAMDLAVGARKTYIMMQHFDKRGNCKIVPRCTYPLTASHCVDRIYTNLAVVDITATGLEVLEIAPGVEIADLERHSDALVHWRIAKQTGAKTSAST